ncbi:hypothetical protein D3C75_854420 [compost metagenome]
MGNRDHGSDLVQLLHHSSLELGGTQDDIGFQLQDGFRIGLLAVAHFYGTLHSLRHVIGDLHTVGNGAYRLHAQNSRILHSFKAGYHNVLGTGQLILLVQICNGLGPLIRRSCSGAGRGSGCCAGCRTGRGSGGRTGRIVVAAASPQNHSQTQYYRCCQTKLFHNKNYSPHSCSFPQ